MWIFFQDVYILLKNVDALKKVWIFHKKFFEKWIFYKLEIFDVFKKKCLIFISHGLCI